MRDFFIGTFEKLIAVIVVLLILAVLVGGLGAMFTQSFLGGLGILIGGALYVIVVGGMLYLVLGVYHNTRRTAEAVERLAAK